MHRPLSALTLAAACAALLAPGAAGASVVQVTGEGTLRVDGQPGEANQVEIRYRTAAEAGFGGISDRIVVEDSAAAQVPPPALPQVPPLVTEPCVSITAETVTCDARLISSIAASLGDANDVLVVNAGKADPIPARLPVRVSGGAGNDVIRGGTGRDRISGDAGSDVVAGWTGDDRLFGGSGSDGVLGFSGDDRLVGGAGPDAIFAQKGRDRLLGGAGIDVLIARDGFRDPVIDCGPGAGQRAPVDRRDPKPRRCDALLPTAKKGRPAA